MLKNFWKQDEKVVKTFMTIAIVYCSANYGNVFLLTAVNLVWLWEC